MRLIRFLDENGDIRTGVCVDNESAIVVSDDIAVNGHGGRSAIPDHENNVSISTVNGHSGRSATPNHGNNVFISTVNHHGQSPATPDYGNNVSISTVNGSVAINHLATIDRNAKERVTVKKRLPPLIPTAILCIGLNYKMHAEETGLPLPKHPVLFMKNPGAVTGPCDDIVIPRSCLDPLQVDYEVELGVIIGKDAKNVSMERALDYVLGYTCTNDISARRWQKHAGGGQWVKAKSFDTFCPMGPEIVTADEIDDPQNLTLTCRLNGEVMQQGSTSDMIFSVAELIARLSESTTLLAGTLILTGTPSGVGFTRNPPVYLKPGDLLESEISGIGRMANRVVVER